MKIFMNIFCLLFSFHDMQIDSISDATRKHAKLPVSEAAI